MAENLPKGITVRPATSADIPTLGIAAHQVGFVNYIIAKFVGSAKCDKKWHLRCPWLPAVLLIFSGQLSANAQGQAADGTANPYTNLVVVKPTKASSDLRAIDLTDLAGCDRASRKLAGTQPV
jgi:hypothetical protein